MKAILEKELKEMSNRTTVIELCEQQQKDEIHLGWVHCGDKGQNKLKMHSNFMSLVILRGKIYFRNEGWLAENKMRDKRIGRVKCERGMEGSSVSAVD